MIARSTVRRLFTRACASLALVSLTIVGGSPVAARRHATDGTGLRGIDYFRLPPDFTFDLGRGPERLDALRGKPVVLNFFATWCEPCRAEIDAFSRLRETYGDGVTIVAISEEAPGTARAFLRAHHLDVPVVEDPTGRIFAEYSIEPIPVTVVLRPDLRVSYVSVGQIATDELATAVERTLADASPAPAFGATAAPGSPAPPPQALDPSHRF